MKTFIFAMLMLLALSGAAFADYYQIDVAASDTIGRAVQGASGRFYCGYYPYTDHRSTVAQDYALKDTDASGKTSMYSYKCDIGLPSSVKMTYLGVDATTPITIHTGTNTVNVVFPNLYDLTVKVVDQNSKPIKGTAVTATPAKSGPLKTYPGTSDANGEVDFIQIPGHSDYLINLKNGDEEKNYPVRIGMNNTEFSAIMATHTLIATVQDDLNNSISGATMRVSRGSEYTDMLTDSGGKASLSGLIPTTYKLTIASGLQSTDMDVKMDKDVSKTVVFDMHAPAISDISVEAKGEKEPIYILAKATDGGSGLKEVRMYYTLNNNNWNEIQTSLTGSGMYRASVPPQPKDTRITYKIVAMDNAGNSVEELKEYATGAGACPIGMLLLTLLPFIALIASKKEGG